MRVRAVTEIVAAQVAGMIAANVAASAQGFPSPHGRHAFMVLADALKVELAAAPQPEEHHE